MAEVIGTLSAIVSLVDFTNLLAITIAKFLRAVGEIPEEIISVRIQIATWQAHLDALYGISQRPDINSKLKNFLDHSDILEEARECLERLDNIISSSFAPESGQSKATQIWDRVKFRRNYGSEVERLLKHMDANTKHLQLALALSTA